MVKHVCVCVFFPFFLCVCVCFVFVFCVLMSFLFFLVLFVLCVLVFFECFFGTTYSRVLPMVHWCKNVKVGFIHWVI